MNKKFVGAPKHPFDFKHQKTVAKKLDAILNAKIVDATGNTVGQIYYADGNTIFEVPAGGGGYQGFVLVSDGGDYYNCYTFDGVTTGSTIVKVAKGQDLRCILPTASPAGGAWATKTKRGTVYTYGAPAATTYTPIAGATADGVNIWEYTRAVYVGGVLKTTSYVTPVLNPGDTIDAVPASFAAPPTLVGVKWLALASGRAWADAS